MKVLIIEDEIPAAKKIERLIREIDNQIEIMAVLESVENASNWLTLNAEPDLIFSDIQLEDGISFEIFEKVKISAPIIFITAFDKYAIDAFKLNSLDYILKPVTLQALQNAIIKYKTFFDKSILQKKYADLFENMQPTKKERFLIKIGEYFKSVSVMDINCFYIKNKCNYLITSDCKSLLIDYSLDKIEQLVDKKRFFRVNRNFIVNINSIEKVSVYSSSRLKVNLIGWKSEEEIIVSRERVSDFKNWMDR